MTRKPSVLGEQFWTREKNLLSRIDEVAEWLRRWTANPMCSARVGSNPILVESFLTKLDLKTICFLAQSPLYIRSIIKFLLRNITDHGKLVKTWTMVDQYIWIIDQVWDQDGWILAKFFFFFARLCTELGRTCKKKANIQPSWPNNLSQ